MKHKTRVLVVTIIILCVMSMVAFAVTEESNEKNFEVDGETYKNTATIDSYPELPKGIIWSSENKLLSGYCSVRASIVLENCVDIGETERETTRLKKFTSSLRKEFISRKYLEYEVKDIFNGGRDVQEYTNNSLNQVVSSSRSVIKAQNNEDNQIDFEYAVKNNEMIPAIGVDGVEGFIYPADYINNGIETPEQALAKQRRRNGNSEYINLYAEDGKTVIGKMEVTYGGTIMK